MPVHLCGWLRNSETRVERLDLHATVADQNVKRTRYCIAPYRSYERNWNRRSLLRGHIWGYDGGQVPLYGDVSSLESGSVDFSKLEEHILCESASLATHASASEAPAQLPLSELLYRDRLSQLHYFTDEVASDYGARLGDAYGMLRRTNICMCPKYRAVLCSLSNLCLSVSLQYREDIVDRLPVGFIPTETTRSLLRPKAHEISRTAKRQGLSKH